MAPFLTKLGVGGGTIAGFGFRKKTGQIPPTYSVSPSTSSINEGSSVTFTITTTNVPDGTTLYWTTNVVSGTVNASDFNDSATSGSFTINSNSGTVTRTLTNDETTEGSESFQIQIRTGSTSGKIVATSSTVTINDTSLSFSASGGTVLTPGDGYMYHVFTSPGIFEVISSSRQIISLVVAGGGSGGTFAPSTRSASGGGAGGLREFTQVIGPGQYPITVGSGGVGSGVPGNPSIFIIESTGGGGGGSWSVAGANGGSGGGGVGGGSGNTPPTSPPQGNPGGGSGGQPIGSGGGGGAGAPGGNSVGPRSGGVGGAGIALPNWSAPIISPAIPAPVQPQWIPAVGPSGLYAGGGAGSGYFGGVLAGGSGGGGSSGATGVQYTGGGGGSPGQSGGSGIVIIRYTL